MCQAKALDSASRLLDVDMYDLGAWKDVTGSGFINLWVCWTEILVEWTFFIQFFGDFKVSHGYSNI